MWLTLCPLPVVPSPKFQAQLVIVTGGRFAVIATSSIPQLSNGVPELLAWYHLNCVLAEKAPGGIAIDW
jgi:hypothetical protein